MPKSKKIKVTLYIPTYEVLNFVKEKDIIEILNLDPAFYIKDDKLVAIGFGSSIAYSPDVDDFIRSLPGEERAKTINRLILIAKLNSKKTAIKELENELLKLEEN